MLKAKRILVGVTGGIAAYKSVELVRGLQGLGAEVRVVMTEAACEFVTPLTFQAISGFPVHTDLLDERMEAAMGHIQLARWADLIVIAPASAQCLSALTKGEAASLLHAVCLATKAPVMLAPAMNHVMWQQTVTQENLATLLARGYLMAGIGSGYQACGETGEGRLLDIDKILAAVTDYFHNDQLSGARVLITAGPTREYIDPVRYITNASSGKMGYAMAQAALDLGAAVTLVSGPVAIDPPARARVIPVVSTQAMLDAVMQETCDIFIAVAAVTDYRPADTLAQKRKKMDDTWPLALVRNPDILSTVSTSVSRPFCVGFAAETHDVASFAKQKLHDKKLDMLILNDVSDARYGFDSNDNAVTVYWRDGELACGPSAKTSLARHLLTLITAHYKRRSAHE